MPVAGERPSMPQPLRWPWMTSCECARRTFMAGRPMEFMLTMRQVPPAATIWSWRRSIWSRSPVRLAAYMTCLPVRSRCRLSTCMTAATRSAKGQCGPSDLELVVLDEVDACFGEDADLFGGGFGAHAEGGFEDGADEGAVVDAG